VVDEAIEATPVEETVDIDFAEAIDSGAADVDPESESEKEEE
jgi:hypothetical protein